MYQLNKRVIYYIRIMLKMMNYKWKLNKLAIFKKNTSKKLNPLKNYKFKTIVANYNF